MPRLEWSGARATGEFNALELSGNTYRYCNNPPNPSLCAEGVQTYRRLVRRQLYDGIDWVIYGRGTDLEYDLIVHPGADLDQVRLQVHGTPASLDGEGRLHAGLLLHWRPVAYQFLNGQKVEIKATLVQAAENEFRFSVGKHDPKHHLIIDPVMEFAVVTGGPAEDIVHGSLSSDRGLPVYVYGTTRSGTWGRIRDSASQDIFVQCRDDNGVSTVFWGGDGDEQIGGADIEGNNNILYIVGWTDSRNATIRESTFLPEPRPYAGGDTDGFMLQVRGSVAYATYIGGPGADRLYDIRLVDGTSNTQFLFAGSTDNAEWPGIDVAKIGAGGKSDAVAGAIQSASARILAIGGSGDDSATRFRRIAPGRWAVGGETDSPDFPSTSGTTQSSGRDIWIGHLTSTPFATPQLRVFGGSGDDHLSGLGTFSPETIFAAGSTTSTDLPAAVNAFLGGSSDGFLARFDGRTGDALGTMYIGGSGADEIAAVQNTTTDLYVAGSSDSPTITAGTVTATGDPAGAVDGFMAQFDPLGDPIFAMRVGGTADDRVLGLESKTLGKVTLAGTSQSAEWLRMLDVFGPNGGQDGFAATFTFAALAPRTPGTVVIGKNLQTDLSFATASEPGLDGLFLVRSSDPSKLLISVHPEREGYPEIILSDSYQYAVFLQALSDEGEVDVIVEPRSGTSAYPKYPARRVRVRLLPSGLDFRSEREFRVAPNSSVEIVANQVPIFPDGTFGPAQSLRGGVTSLPVLVTPDPSALEVLSPIEDIRQVTGGYRVTVRVWREGEFQLSLTSPALSTTLGPPVTVRSAPATTPQDVPMLSLTRLRLAVDHFTAIQVQGAPGSTVTLVSSDAARLKVSLSMSTGFSERVSVPIPANGTATAYLAAYDETGEVAVRAEGTRRGQNISEQLIVRLLPYVATLEASPRVIAVGTWVYAKVAFAVQAPPDDPGPLPPSMWPMPNLLQQSVLLSTNPAVLALTGQNYDGTFVFQGKSPGTAKLEFAPGGMRGLGNLSVTAEVVPATVRLTASEVAIPAGSYHFVPISYSNNSEILKSTRLRFDVPTPLVLDAGIVRGTDITADLSRFGVHLDAANAPVGTRATLLISTSTGASVSLPIRVVEPVLLPDVEEVRVTRSPENAGRIFFKIVGFENGKIIFPAAEAYMRRRVTLRTMVGTPGICDFPASVELPSSDYFRFRCNGDGETSFALEAAPPFASAQSQFRVRVIAGPPAVNTPLPKTVMAGNGLQTQIGMMMGFSGVLTSSDPARVRLSLDGQTAGSEQILLNGSRFYVQGYASDGIVPIVAESSQGKSVIFVHLFPSTLAVRVNEDRSTRVIERPVTDQNLTFAVLPSLVDPGSGKVIDAGREFEIRGGTDPMLLAGQSSDPNVAKPAVAKALLTEGKTGAQISFDPVRPGSTILAVEQPSGFVSVPESGLQVRMVELGLRLSLPQLLLSRDLQTAVSVEPSIYGANVAPSQVTISSHDPAKLTVSKTATVPGQTTITAPMGQTFFIQAMSEAQPGDMLRLRLEAPGYSTSDALVPIAPAQLDSSDEREDVTLDLGSGSSVLRLSYGPVDRATGRRSRYVSVSLRPGVSGQLRLASTDTNILEVPEPSVTFATQMAIPLHPVRPGKAQIRIEAPPDVPNAVETINVTVRPYRFNFVSSDISPRHLVTRLQIRNPRTQPVAITFSSAGQIPIRLGTAASGAGAPAGATLLLNIPANDERSLYIEPGAGGTTAAIRMTAPDYEDQVIQISVPEPSLNVEGGSTVTTNLSTGTLALPVVLSTERPLGSSFGPSLPLRIVSSNPQVARPTAESLTILPGENRKAFTLQLTGRGDTTITVFGPAGFGGPTAPLRRDVLVTVR